MSQYENSTTVAEQRQRILRLEVRNSALAADNKALESEVAALRAERDEHARWRSKLADKLHAAEAELAALKAAQHPAQMQSQTAAPHTISNPIVGAMRQSAQPERVSVPSMCPENMQICDWGCSGGWCITMFGSQPAAQEGK